MKFELDLTFGHAPWSQEICEFCGGRSPTCKLNPGRKMENIDGLLKGIEEDYFENKLFFTVYKKRRKKSCIKNN